MRDFYKNEVPTVIITWTNSTGEHFLNCKTEKITNTIPKGYDMSVKRGSSIFRGYMKYHQKEDLLEMSVITLNTNISGSHEWRYSGNRFFINHDKEMVDENNNPIYGRKYLYNYFSPYDGKSLIQMFLHTVPYGIDYTDEIKKFIGGDTFVIGNGTVEEVSGNWSIYRWYTTSQKPRGKGRESKLVEDLTDIPLSEVNTLLYPTREISKTTNYGTYVDNIPDFVYGEKVNPEWYVLRYFHRCNGEPQETWRTYISKNKIRIASKKSDSWVTSSLSNNWWYKAYFANSKQMISDCERLKYIANIFDKCECYNGYRQIINVLRYPELEQMFKFGYEEKSMSLSISNTPKADIKHFFGDIYDEKQKTLLKRVGMTKPQFDIYMSMKEKESWCTETSKAWKLLNEMHNDTIHLDINTFENELKCLREFANKSYRRGSLRDIFYDVELDYEKFIKNLIRLSKKCPSNIYQVVADTLQSYRSINNKPEVNWYFDSWSDIIRMHDALDEIKRREDAERRAMWDMKEAERLKKEEEKRKLLDEQRKKYEYEDDEYIIRLPKDNNEIIREGSMQRICIGGYTTRHSMGYTNLYFLRKKDDETTPFYAIEVDNSNKVVQIHGYCNKWLGCHPEAIPTVVRWLRKNGFRCDETILRSTSTGYSNYGASLCDMPVVD